MLARRSDGSIVAWGDTSGLSRQQVPLGNGWSCLAGSTQVVPLPLLSTPGGVVQLPVDLTQPPFGSGANAIQPGSTWSLQLTCRDPLAAPSGFGSSDAVHLVFAP